MSTKGTATGSGAFQHMGHLSPKKGRGGMVAVDDDEEEEDEGPPPSGPKLQEWVRAAEVRRRPGGFPPGTLELVRVGDALELFYKDAWWDVEVQKIEPKGSVYAAEDAKAAEEARRYGRRRPEVDAARDPLDEKRFTVVYYTVDGPVAHRVSARRLRPRWLWAAEPEVWRFELLCGHGCVPKNPDRPGGRPTFSFSKGSMRSRGM